MFAFVERTDAVTTSDDWDTLGMRGTQSRTTRLNGAVADAAHVVRRIDPGPSPDPIVFGIFSVFEILLASVYTGIARRALELAIATAQKRHSKKTGLAYSQDPDIRWRIADMGLAYDALPPQIAALARDVDDRVDNGARWFPLLSGVKHRAITMAKHVVDEAMLVAGVAPTSRRTSCPGCIATCWRVPSTPPTPNPRIPLRRAHCWVRSSPERIPAGSVDEARRDRGIGCLTR